MRMWYKFRQWWWDFSSDLGDLVVVLIGLVLCVFVCILVWMGIVGVESYLR